MAWEGGEAVKEPPEAERGPDRFPQRRQRLSRQLRLDEIGEAAGATLTRVVVELGQMHGIARPTPVFRPFDKPRLHRVHSQRSAAVILWKVGGSPSALSSVRRDLPCV